MAGGLTAQDIVQNAFNRFGEDYSNVNVKVVEPGHWALKRPGQDRVAAAMRTQGGGEWVVVSNAFSETPDYQSLLEHEIAHLRAWRKYGEGIREHGRRFNAFCRETVTNRPNYFCKRG